ncbi:glutathione S-transferase family protein [Sphingomonas solaris]|uniref:glutathione transferase n=1 Tax=Alterirhizorhabdus solaris TaxID=2529389 RepID=A0A558QSJ1_9SPHN|nr:glutathione S-transferase [Sphingomonas solaris]TVV70111.1 glutathione S-transferase [Sphingomonas solaris]
MSIIVHHLENSRSQRILWLLEELGLPYSVKRYAREPKTMLAPPALKQVHPLGKSPLVEHDGRVLAETGAIVEYLVELGGRLGTPGNRDAALRYRHFLHYAEGSMMPPLLSLLIIQRLGLLGRPVRGFVQKLLDGHLDWLETELTGRPWFAGSDFTAADVMMSFPLEASRQRGGLDASRPHLTAWLDRIHARPAYVRALAAGGPYVFA